MFRLCITALVDYYKDLYLGLSTSPGKEIFSLNKISMKIRNLVSLAVLCIAIMSFTSIPSGKSAAGKGATSTIVDISGEFNASCAERLDVTGYMHVLAHAVTNKNKTTVTFVYNYQGVSGVGEESGQRYIVVGRSRNTQSVTLSSGEQYVTMYASENLVAPGKGVVKFSIKGYYKIAGDGTMLAQNFEVATCD